MFLCVTCTYVDFVFLPHNFARERDWKLAEKSNIVEKNVNMTNFDNTSRKASHLR